MKTFLRHSLAIASAALISACDGRPDRPDSTTTGMQGGTAPAGVDTFRQSSGQGAVEPQNLGTTSTPQSPPSPTSNQPTTPPPAAQQ